jgi:hypothetical protein
MELGWIHLESQCVIVVYGKTHELRGLLFEINGPKYLHFIII